MSDIVVVQLEPPPLPFAWVMKEIENQNFVNRQRLHETDCVYRIHFLVIQNWSDADVTEPTAELNYQAADKNLFAHLKYKCLS